MQHIDDYRWLVGSTAEPWLDRARVALAQSPGAVAGLIGRLRKDLSPERAQLVVEQTELRHRAREKFTRAEQMFFTRKGLEQATDDQVAAIKAERFPAFGAVADLCCGIGGDLLALAHRSPHAPREKRAAVGADLDPTVALLADANLRAYDCPHASVVNADAAALLLTDFAAWHIDPDRRAMGHRTSRVEFFEPSVEIIERLLAANPNGAIKLAPAARVPSHWDQAAELAWLGSRGECRQQVAWLGSLAWHPGQHTATVVDALGGPRTIVGRPDEPIPMASSLGRYLYEPHAAVLAAKLTAALCRTHALAAVSSGIAYLTGNKLIDEPICDAFEVVDVLRMDQKKLRAYCRERNIGRLEVKKRGVDVDPAKLRQAVIAAGDNTATLIVTRVQRAVQAIFARRISLAPSADPADQ